MAGTSLAVIAARLNAVVVPNKPGWANSMQIRSETSSALYTISQNVSNGEIMRGQWGCSCLGWIMSAKRNNGVRGCKHLRAMLPVLEAAFPSNQQTTQAPAKPVATKRIGR